MLPKAAKLWNTKIRWERHDHTMESNYPDPLVALSS